MADKNLDEYKPLKFYKDNSKARQNGFAKFKDKSKSAAEHVAGRLNGSVKTAKKSAPKKAAAPAKSTAAKKKVAAKTDGRIENYHPLAFYEARNGDVKNGFASFSEGKAHYFTYNQKGKVVLISESYTSKAGRDNGIKSVMKNMPLKERYEPHVHKNGKHYFDLNAGNGQEIATSVWYGSAAAALAGAAALRGEKAKKTSANNEDDYRPLAFYNKHTKGRKKGIETFKGDDGEYYFAYFENGKIRLISEGYPTSTARDTGVASVEKNIKLPKRYDYRGPFKNGKYDYRLKAGNGKEIARSIWYGSAAAAATGAAYLMGTRKRPVKKAKPKAAPIVAAAAVATASAAPAMAKKAAPVPPRDKDDDYLNCEAYHGHKVTDLKNNVAFFSHENNKEYFVVYDENGDVLIRSEGFESISKRSSELNAVLRLKDDASNFTRIEKNGYFMDVLKDENGREVGRSCLRKVVPPLAAVPPVATAAAIAAPVAAAAATVPGTAAAGGMGLGWLKWLIPLLPKKLAAEKAAAAKKLAAEKTAAAAAAALAAAEKAAAEVAPEPTPEPTPEPVAPKAVTANMSRLCGASDTALFNVPTYATPINVIRLGTYPQFGDSHGLTPRQFFDKLSMRFASNNYDRQYLNYLAKQLGYAGGFSDMSAADFSDDTLAKGAKGVLGYGEFHGMAYSQLNVRSSRDLDAFRVRAANGTDIHFMKSCGNYMYVCN